MRLQDKTDAVYKNSVFSTGFPAIFADTSAHNLVDTIKTFPLNPLNDCLEHVHYIDSLLDVTTIADILVVRNFIIYSKICGNT